MFHAVLLFIAACKLMLFDFAGHIVIYIGSYYNAVLGAAIHGLGINVVMLGVILFEPSLLLKVVEILHSLGVHHRIMFIRTRQKVYFRLYDVIQ